MPVVNRPGDPYTYLFVPTIGEWYCYDPHSQPLGSGAMGTVYLGYRCCNGNKVAVKRVNDSFANNKMIRERAKQEASLTFRHPNLVEMVGYCEAQANTGPIFIISNYVNGQNIDKFFSNQEDPDRTEKICSCICSVLDALNYIHSRGVIHRDIKPSNIMIENGSSVRLMDLGISRVNGGNKFSVQGFIGTPEYSAPEQIVHEIEGGVARISAATDIYELGITFYELLAGYNPMSMESEADTLIKQMKSSLPANQKIPKPLFHVILKATEKNPQKRYQSALDFKDAILKAQQPEPDLITKISNWLNSLFS